jgi:hypothetical protein
MRTRIVEATNYGSGGNWGKFLIGVMDREEWSRRSSTPGCESTIPLLAAIGWRLTDDTFWMMDLQTREGAAFRHGGHARADLLKHKIWVCPMYEPMLEWLYKQPRDKVMALDLPEHVDVEAGFSMAGYRRPGPEAA